MFSQSFVRDTTSNVVAPGKYGSAALPNEIRAISVTTAHGADLAGAAVPVDYQVKFAGMLNARGNQTTSVVVSMSGSATNVTTEFVDADAHVELSYPGAVPGFAAVKQNPRMVVADGKRAAAALGAVVQDVNQYETIFARLWGMHRRASRRATPALVPAALGFSAIDVSGAGAAAGLGFMGICATGAALAPAISTAVADREIDIANGNIPGCLIHGSPSLQQYPMNEVAWALSTACQPNLGEAVPVTCEGRMFRNAMSIVMTNLPSYVVLGAQPAPGNPELSAIMHAIDYLLAVTGAVNCCTVGLNAITGQARFQPALIHTLENGNKFFGGANAGLWLRYVSGLATLMWDIGTNPNAVAYDPATLGALGVPWGGIGAAAFVPALPAGGPAGLAAGNRSAAVNNGHPAPPARLAANLHGLWTHVMSSGYDSALHCATYVVSSLTVSELDAICGTCFAADPFVNWINGGGPNATMPLPVAGGVALGAPAFRLDRACLVTACGWEGALTLRQGKGIAQFTQGRAAAATGVPQLRGLGNEETARRWHHVRALLMRVVSDIIMEGRRLCSCNSMGQNTPGTGWTEDQSRVWELHEEADSDTRAVGYYSEFSTAVTHLLGAQPAYSGQGGQLSAPRAHGTYDMVPIVLTHKQRELVIASANQFAKGQLDLPAGSTFGKLSSEAVLADLNGDDRFGLLQGALSLAGISATIKLRYLDPRDNRTLLLDVPYKFSRVYYDGDQRHPTLGSIPGIALMGVTHSRAQMIITSVTGGPPLLCTPRGALRAWGPLQAGAASTHFATGQAFAAGGNQPFQGEVSYVQQGETLFKRTERLFTTVGLLWTGTTTSNVSGLNSFEMERLFGATPELDANGVKDWLHSTWHTTCVWGAMRSAAPVASTPLKSYCDGKERPSRLASTVSTLHSLVLPKAKPAEPDKAKSAAKTEVKGGNRDAEATSAAATAQAAAEAKNITPPGTMAGGGSPSASSISPGDSASQARAGSGSPQPGFGKV